MILVRRRRRTSVGWPSMLASGDQDGADVVDVGQRRAGADRGRRSRRTACSCRGRPAAARGSSPAARARASVSGVTMAPAASSVPSMPSVSPATAQMSRRAGQRHREAEQEFGVAAAAPGRAVADRHGGLAAGQQHRGRRERHGRARRRSGRCRPCTMPISRASPSSASPRISGVRPSARAASAAWRQRHHRRGDQAEFACGSSPGFGVSSRRGSSRAATAGDGVDAVARDDRARVGEGGGVGHGRARGDHRRIVAGHVADRQRHHARRTPRRRQAGRP